MLEIRNFFENGGYDIAVTRAGEFGRDLVKKVPVKKFWASDKPTATEFLNEIRQPTSFEVKAASFRLTKSEFMVGSGFAVRTWECAKTELNVKDLAGRLGLDDIAL